MSSASQLARELEFYEEIKSDLLENYEGLFVLIKGSELIGKYRSAEIAYEHGIEQFKLEPFLVKQVSESEPTEFIPAFNVIPNADL